MYHFFFLNFTYKCTDEPVSGAGIETQTKRMGVLTQWEKERVRRIGRLELTYIHYHVRQLVGICSKAQVAQLGAL